MHWIRIDSYFRGDISAPEVVHQPVACHHCESAPCEQVCPVAATVHSHEGLNDMVYNRCVGTRYCSNNCPYKVRRFNFFNYHKNLTDVEKMQFNPEVTVRSRGVMEKCTFCIQRIRTGKDKAARENREVQDGDVITACAQSCPTQAIVFGDMLDEDSAVKKLWAKQQVELGKTEQAKDKADSELRGYRVLEGLNTDPSVMYLDRVREA